MHLKDEFRVPQAPRLYVGAYPAQEHEAVRFIARRLLDVERYADNFAHAVALHDFCMGEYSRQEVLDETGVLFHRWSFIPCRDACMSLFHFCKSIENLPFGAAAVQFRKDVNRRAMSEARNRFRSAIPTIEALRVSIAHSSEINDTPEKQRRNIADHPRFGRVSSQDSFLNGLFSQTFEGVLLQVRLDGDTILLVNSIADQFFSAFSGCSKT